MTRGWDDITEDAPLRQMVQETIARVTQSNPLQCLWCATGQDINVWVDTSFLSTGMLLEHNVVFKMRVGSNPRTMPSTLTWPNSMQH